jgi:hypothetical protein
MKATFFSTPLLLLSLTVFGQEMKSPPPSINWAVQDIVVIGEIKKIRSKPIVGVKPTIFSYNLEVKVEELLKGELTKNKVRQAPRNPKPLVKNSSGNYLLPIKAIEEKEGEDAGKLIQIRYSVRQKQEPVFPEDLNQTRSFVALAKEGTTFRFLGWEPISDAREKEVRFECTLPYGWIAGEGEILSPWAELQCKWPKKVASKEGSFSCSRTGRPSFEWNEKATMAITKVPSVFVTNLNRDGDGEIRLTVSNFTNQPLTLPALRRTDKRILWKESLVVIIKGQAFKLPGSKGISYPTEAVELKPNEEISFVVNPLAVRDANWPKPNTSSSAERIYFQFCLGHHSQKVSFYYYRSHHDKIRRKLLAGQPLRPLFLGD